MCPLPSPDAGRGLGAGRSPQGNICTFQTCVVSGAGERQARHPHPALDASLETGLGGTGSAGAACGHYVTRASQPAASSLWQDRTVQQPGAPTRPPQGPVAGQPCPLPEETGPPQPA